MSFFFSVLIFAQDSKTDPCKPTQHDIALYQKKVAELTREIETLEREKGDEKNPISENRKKKADFAKKKLTQKKQINESLLKDTLSSYCKTCKDDKLCAP